MEQEKKKKNENKRIIISAVVLVAALVLCGPIDGLLDNLTDSFDWTISFRLAAMIAGLSLVGAVCTLFFQHWMPRTGQSKTMFTLANSAIRYILVIAGLMWGLSILGVDVNALLAGAGVVALTQIGIRTTSITDTGGNVKIINNSDIRSLINRSADSSVAVCDLGVLYDGEAVRRAEKVLAETIDALYEAHKEVFREKPRYLGVQELNLSENAAVLRVVASVTEENIYTAQRLMNRELMMALEDAGCGNPPAEIVVSHQN